ncbi:hypothetical protein GCM10009737_22760 [Nocardioides lentus]|uniref:DUF2786 domain-containing protein n=1 Tax=Nocardioides lentus TaxID=338077 RepID=A0ABN2PHJ8_9ACTN
MGIEDRRPAAGEALSRRAEGHDPTGSGDPAARRAADEVAEQARLSGLVTAVVARIDGTRRDDARLATYADMLVHRAAPAGADEVLGVVERLLARLLARAAAGGWPEGDLAPLVERTLGPAHVTTLDEVRRRRPLRHLGSGLGLAALLGAAPLLETRALVAPTPATGEHPRLARVRALLAKAESTDHPAEAELLSAKAQELVARHALEGLVGSGETGRAGGPGPAGRPRARRVWLDAPYVDAKAALVAAVAAANRCRSAVAVSLGFCVVVGHPRDLDAVELLTASLLVQAQSALAHHGRRTGEQRGRTRAFRRAFLLAYATRVGERLEEATATAYREAGGDALPVVRAAEQRVEAAFAEAVPHTVGRPATVSHPDGWVAGRHAADLARLDVRDELREHRDR